MTNIEKLQRYRAELLNASHALTYAVENDGFDTDDEQIVRQVLVLLAKLHVLNRVLHDRGVDEVVDELLADVRKLVVWVPSND